MHALVYDGAGAISWDAVADPRIIDDTDAIIKVTATTICGTDLHIIKGDVPEVTAGTVLGHEGVGIVEAVGNGVRSVRVGDRVLVSCISACGICRFCREQRYGQCLSGGGWVLGHTIDGLQADYARVPFADLSLHRLPDSIDDVTAVLFSDVMPTSWEVGVRAGAVEPGDVIVVVGAGPIGLGAVLTSRLLTPGLVVVIEPNSVRRDAAWRLGADVCIDPAADDLEGRVLKLTEGRGADVVIEAVGTPDSFELCTRIVRAGGHLANVGVHGRPATLHLETLWTKDITLTMGLVDTATTPRLLGLAERGQLDPAPVITHRLELTDLEQAYDVFTNAGDTGALKVAAGPGLASAHSELALLDHGSTP